MLLLGLQAVRKGDNIVGLFFSTFGPFVVAFGLLIIGLEHGWWGIPLAGVPHAEGAFLLAWTIILTVWFFLSFVLPTIFTLLLTFVDIALWSLVIGIWNTTSGPQKVAGWMLFVTGQVHCTSAPRSGCAGWGSRSCPSAARCSAAGSVWRHSPRPRCRRCHPRGNQP
jgi:hypothetical protein